MFAVGDLGTGHIHKIPLAVGKAQGTGKILTVRLALCLGGSLINGAGKGQQQLAAEWQIHHAIRGVGINQSVAGLRRDKHIRVVFTGIQQGIKQK